MKNANGVEEVDSKFDKAERIWDRLQKLLLKIVGGIVGITLAIYIAYGQLKDKHEEHFEQEKIEHAEELKKEKEKKKKATKKKVVTQTVTDHFSPYNDNNNINHKQKQDYLLLSRLQSDCEYFLGSGNRNDTILFNNNIREHIKSMKELWIGLDTKPEWLSMKDIIKYERKMKAIIPETETVTETEVISEVSTETVVETPVVEEVVEEVVETETETEVKPEYTITKKTWDIDTIGERKGDTIYIDYYSDGYIEKYYTDGKPYIEK